MAFFDDIYVKKPVNRQAAAGCQRIGEPYDEKEFHPLAGKSCLRWALENCRDSASRQELIYKIASGCNVPILEVGPMVENWIQSGRAVWEGERLVIRKKKMQEPSEASRKSMTLWLLTRQKVVKACNVLKDILRVAPVFWIGRYKDGSYDVVIRNGTKLESFSDLIEKFSRERIVFRGAKEEVACAALMLRLEYGRIVASSPSQTPLTVYNVYNPSEELMGRIESMTIPMD